MTNQNVLIRAVDYLNNRGVLLPPALVDDLEMFGALKTVDYYTRVLKKLIRDLYNGKITEDQFVDSHAGYVERQIRRAFNVGMRENGLDPRKDMTPEWEALYQEWVIEEYQYIDRLASEIFIASIDGEPPIDGFLRRADLWANRYTDIVNRAKAYTGLTVLFEWELGETEHCSDCLVNAGQVRTGEEWLNFIMPQSKELECGGWRCACTLELVG